MDGEALNLSAVLDRVIREPRDVGWGLADNFFCLLESRCAGQKTPFAFDLQDAVENKLPDMNLGVCTEKAPQ